MAPPADQLASRVLLGPALRTQPDRRLVTLVREGYEAAFEEIVRRYRRPLDRFAAAIVGSRSEDVTQDALSKALLALRGSEAEIELRPWLYRIVRNTALNELRDRPPGAEQLAEDVAGGVGVAEAAERREEIAALVEGLRALPEPQRAAIVMRELEGLSHEEIAAALGVSGGAARQAIFRARAALRNGLGILIPLPLLRLLFDHGAEAAAAGAEGAAAAGAGLAGGGGGAALGGLGAGGAVKAGLATALVAGSVGAGAVALQEQRGAETPQPAAAAVSAGGGAAAGSQSATGSGTPAAPGPAPDTSGPAGEGGGEQGDGRVRKRHEGDGGAARDDRHRGEGRRGRDRRRRGHRSRPPRGERQTRHGPRGGRVREGGPRSTEGPRHGPAGGPRGDRDGSGAPAPGEGETPTQPPPPPPEEPAEKESSEERRGGDGAELGDVETEP